MELVRRVFEACPKGDSKDTPPVKVPTHYDVRAAVFSDSEATSSSMVLEVKQASLGGGRKGCVCTHHAWP